MFSRDSGQHRRCQRDISKELALRRFSDGLSEAVRLKIAPWCVIEWISALMPNAEPSGANVRKHR